MRYTGPKDRLSRREGVDLFGAGIKLTRVSVPPGQHGPKGLSRMSIYAKQLREKQKVKRMYGVSESQFRAYYEVATKSRGNTGETFLAMLERRLDNVVYRLGFAPSRPASRQLVSHRQVLVNGKRVNIPSYQVKSGDLISLTPKAVEIPYVKQILSNKEKKLPTWLERKAAVGKIKLDPKRDDITEPINESDIVEFYSR